MSIVDYIIVTKDQLHYTRQCIESIFAHTGVPFHLILVDNASTDGTRDYFEELQKNFFPSPFPSPLGRGEGEGKQPVEVKITIIFNRENLGYVAGVNQGLERALSSYVILSNNDIVLYPGAVSELIHVANLRPEFGLVNPNSNEFGFGDYDEGRLKQLRGTFRERHHISGFFALLKREVIERVGKLDPIYSPGYFEEMDFCERAKQAGYLCVIANGAYVHHYGSRSFLPKQKQEAWDKNCKIFNERWGGTKWFFYVADERLKRDSTYRQKVIDSLLLETRKNMAMLYLFIPHGTKKYFENIHDGFRFIESPGIARTLLCLAKIWRSAKNKPISRVYVSNDQTFSSMQKLKPLHHIEVVKI